MPILLTNRNYVDVFGNSRTFYKSNAGDMQRVRFSLRESISVMSSPSVNLSLNIPAYEITWLGGDFEDEGFRTGDTISVRIYDNTGTTINAYSANVNCFDVFTNPCGVSTGCDDGVCEILTCSASRPCSDGMTQLRGKPLKSGSSVEVARALVYHLITFKMGL